MCCLQDHIFPRDIHTFFNKTIQKHSAHITKAWLRRKRVWLQDWPACSLDLSPTENVGEL